MPVEKLVLVVDDQLGIRLLLAEVLQEYGYQVALASDGGEAWQQAARKRPDLVLLDMNMPGLGGVDTLAKLRQLYPDLPVLMLTADEDEDKWAQVEQLGVQGKIDKPFDLDDLYELLQANIA